jgi:hypothetical protein
MLKVNTKAKYGLSQPKEDATLLVVYRETNEEYDSHSSRTRPEVLCELTSESMLKRLLDDYPATARGLQVFRLTPVQVNFIDVLVKKKSAVIGAPPLPRATKRKASR